MVPFHIEHLAHQPAGLFGAVEKAVVAVVLPVLPDHRHIGGQDGEHLIGEGKLLLRRVAAGHVEAETSGLDAGILLGELLVEFFQLL